MSIHTTQDDHAAGLAGYCHPLCLVCGDQNVGGPHLRFRLRSDGKVVGKFDCDASYQGYPDRLHGGVVSMLLDAALMNCLFAHGIQAVTARLSVRFSHPVRPGESATIRAWVVDQRHFLFRVESELLQDGKICAAADAKFYHEEVVEQD